MGKSAGDAPEPDPKIGEAALLQAQTGADYLAFAQSAFGVSMDRQKELDALAKEVSDRQYALAQEQFDYTKSVTDKQFGLAQQQFDFSKDITSQQLEMARSQDAYSRTVTDRQLKLSEDAAKYAKNITDRQMKVFEEQAGYAREDRQRYKTVFQPIEDKFVKEASEYGSPERQSAAAAEAKADVQSAAATAKETANREAAAMGISPNSGRFAGIQRAGELGTALATAGAANTARTSVRDKGLALKADVANLGRGLPTQSAQAAAVGLSASNAAQAGNLNAAGMQINAAGMGLNNANQATALSLGVGNSAIANMGNAAQLGIGVGNSAIGNMGNAAGMGINAAGLQLAGMQNNNAQYMASTDIMGAGYKGAMAGYGGMASTLNNQYQTQMQGYGIQQQAAAQNAAGIGSALGGIFGLFLSDEDLKTDKTEIPEGTALEMVKEMPVEEWTYKQGVADGGRHVGTYAQDFQKATGKGDGTTIPAQDAIGVTMKAVQDLDKKVERIAAAVGIRRPAPADAKRSAPGLKRAA